jgi:hypothetical protein
VFEELPPAPVIYQADEDEEVEEDAYEFYSDEEGEADGGGDAEGDDDWE